MADGDGRGVGIRAGRTSDALVQARREAVLEIVLDRGEVGISELADEFGISEMTVHRDLDALHRDGFLTKDRGRAVAPSAVRVETSALFRLRAAKKVKEAIARGAVARLAGVRTLLVDDSTSVLPLLPLVAAAATEPVTVVTNSLLVIRAAAKLPGLEPHLLGGSYDHDLEATFGTACTDSIARWRAEVAVVSVPALRDGQCFHMLPSSAAVKRAMFAAAAERLLLIDHTKVGRTAPHLLCDVEAFSWVVLDDGVDPAEIFTLQSRGVAVDVVPIDPRSSG
ncbi:MAG TPA: DeoR/GlpR family DNA-binding transcription regulator [Kribbella sp.]|nr:DeoR/GlpR family DNA-binding transcription regulator [Kribbella sp.]